MLDPEKINACSQVSQSLMMLLRRCEFASLEVPEVAYNHKHIMNNLSKFGFEIHVLLYHILSNSFLKIVFLLKNPE